MVIRNNIMNIKILDVKVTIDAYSVSAILLIPDRFKKAVIIANGAGANMHNVFISRYCKVLAESGLMSVKFNFHYQEIGRKIPDKNEKCQQTYLGIINFLKEKYINEKDIIIGGKSMGGRIATHIADKVQSEKIIVWGYPLHPPGKPEKMRDAHLYSIRQKVLIIQGENDAFGSKMEIEPVINRMKNARSLIIPQGNHSLKVPKKSGLDNANLEKLILSEILKFINDN